MNEQNLLLTFLDNFVRYGVGPICTFLAGVMGLKFGLKQIKEEKKLDFVEKQLREFYSPLNGFLKEIRAKGQTRFKIETLSNVAWREKCERSGQDFNSDEEFKTFDKIIDYDNNQLRERIMPLYREMLSVFRDKYWLAEPDTSKYFNDFSEFVEIWERSLQRALPREVIIKLDHSEEKLKPFYDELELRLQVLRNQLSGK